MNYFQWFIKEGWKKYLLPFILGIAITTGLIRSYDDIMNAPKIVVYLFYFTSFGFDIAIIYHSIMTWKISTKR